MIPLLAMVASTAGACPAERARYTLRTQPAVTAEFRHVASGRDWPSELALSVRGLPHAWWFVPWQGGTDGRQHLASTTDVEAPGWRPPSPDGGPRPHGDFTFITTDANYDLTDLSRASEAAPAHMLIYELSDAVWHSQHISIAMQFFDLVGCRPAVRVSDTAG